VSTGWLMGRDIFADGEYSAYKGWIDRLSGRQAIKAALDHKAELMSKGH